MKIAYINDLIYPYEIGGAQKRVWEIARRMAQRGHEVHWYGMKFWDGDDLVITEKVSLHGVCPKVRIYTGDRRSIYQALYFALKLYKPLMQERFDLIDASNFPYFPCFIAGLHALRKKSRLVITWLEVWLDFWYEYLGWLGLFGRIVEKIAARLSRNMIAISDSTRQRLIRLGVSGNISVVPCGLDLADFEKVEQSSKKSDVIFAGRLIKEKNVDLLINSIKIVKMKIPDIKCLIIGNGPEKNELEKLVARMDLVGNVVFLGFLSDYREVYAHFKSSKVFVLPSTREGFGIVVLEANACGLPVVAIDHPLNAAKDLIDEGRNGFLSQRNDGDLAEKIVMSLNHGEKMASRCRSHAQKYTWDIVVKSCETAYRSAFA